MLRTQSMRKVLVFSDFVKGLENRWGISENKSTILRYQYQRCVDIKKKKKLQLKPGQSMHIFKTIQQKKQSTLNIHINQQDNTRICKKKMMILKSYRDEKIQISSDHTWRNSPQEMLFGFKWDVSSSKDPPNNPNELSPFLWPDPMTQMNSLSFLLPGFLLFSMRAESLSWKPPPQKPPPCGFYGNWQPSILEESWFLQILCFLH